MRPDHIQVTDSALMS